MVWIACFPLNISTKHCTKNRQPYETAIAASCNRHNKSTDYCWHYISKNTRRLSVINAPGTNRIISSNYGFGGQNMITYSDRVTAKTAIVDPVWAIVTCVVSVPISKIKVISRIKDEVSPLAVTQNPGRAVHKNTHCCDVRDKFNMFWKYSFLPRPDCSHTEPRVPVPSAPAQVMPPATFFIPSHHRGLISHWGHGPIKARWEFAMHVILTSYYIMIQAKMITPS